LDLLATGLPRRNYESALGRGGYACGAFAMTTDIPPPGPRVVVPL